MTQYQEEFICFLAQSKVIRFGDFITKSGRSTPYFLNLGNISDGRSIKRLGEFYAHALHARIGKDFDFLFGPAYKGIPLVVATAIALQNLYDINVRYAFNRKEIKDHGEGGAIIGHQPRDGDRMVILEDVITAGTAVHECLNQLGKIARLHLAGLMVAVDRQEKGKGEHSALHDIRVQHGCKTFGIVTIDNIIKFLIEHEIEGSMLIDPEILTRIRAYREKYGCN